MIPKRVKETAFALSRIADRCPGRALFWILLSAALVRLLFVAAFPGLYSGAWLDSIRYERVAFNLIVGRGFSEYYGIPTAFVGPGYPYFLAGVHLAFGPGALPVQLIQVLLGVLVCAACYSMARQLADRRAGLIAAALAAFSPELALMTGFLYTETLFMLLTSWSVVLLVAGFSGKGGWKAWIGGGLLFGLGLLTRHVLLFFPPVLFAAALLLKKTRPRVKGIAAFMVCAYALLIPWAVRNYRTFGALVPVATGGGQEFWIGSYLPFQGKYHYDETREQIKKLSAGARDEVERDRLLTRAGLQNIAGHPAQYLGMAVRRFFRFFFQVYQDMPTGKPRSFNALVLVVLALTYYPVLLLAFASAAFAKKSWIPMLPLYGILLYSALICAFVHVVPRYRIPLMPFFIVLAALAAVRIVLRTDLQSNNRR
jgi:4-amino-4-deoxy-L-arabinose transferase-like glycosyltransferase